MTAAVAPATGLHLRRPVPDDRADRHGQPGPDRRGALRRHAARSSARARRSRSRTADPPAPPGAPSPPATGPTAWVIAKDKNWLVGCPPIVRGASTPRVTAAVHGASATDRLVHRLRSRRGRTEVDPDPRSTMSQSTTPDAAASGPPTRGRYRRVLAGLSAASVAATTLASSPPGTAFAAVPKVARQHARSSPTGTSSPSRATRATPASRHHRAGPRRQGHRLRDRHRLRRRRRPFEVNHPGGVCWGAGAGIKVTPGHPARRRRDDQVRRHHLRRHHGADAGDGDAPTPDGLDAPDARSW